MDLIAENYLSSSDEDPYAGDDSDKDPIYNPEEATTSRYINYFFERNDNEYNSDNSNIEEIFRKANHNEATLNNSEMEQEKAKRKLTRKRKRQPDTWKRNINRKLCQHGKEYTNVKGELRRKREIKSKKNCTTRCKFKCSVFITDNERKQIHEEFWTLSDDCKLHFYNETTSRGSKKRNTVKQGTKSTRKYSYSYYFYVNEKRIRVCKQFYLDTLDVSQRRITYFYENKQQELTGTPKQIIRGKHPKRIISPDQKQLARDHILSIPRVESHYCRQRTSKEYLESNLNLSKLYDLYTEMCIEKKLEPVKLSYYRHIFNYEYNIEFLKPKSDRCDTCEEIRIAKHSGQQIIEEVLQKYEQHKHAKDITKKNRDADRENTDKDTAIICFDMENVFPLPRSNISCFFYSKKLNTYNLTAHLNLTKKGYCAIWSEGIHGRKAIEISSALVKILSKIVEEHGNVTKLILWSDSCVPQNRNSIMTLALKKFMEQNTQIKEITQKFSEPGHGCVQEVDNLHSQIEKSISGQEIFSPLGLLRALLRVNRRNPLKAFHMKISDFKEFQQAAKTLNFKDIPFASVKQLKYLLNEPWTIYFKLDHSGPFTKANIKASHGREKRLFTGGSNSLGLLPSVRNCVETKYCLLAEDKVFHLYKLFKFMPAVDVAYIKCLFHEYKQEMNIKKLRKKLKGTEIDFRAEADAVNINKKSNSGKPGTSNKV